MRADCPNWEAAPEFRPKVVQAIAKRVHQGVTIDGAAGKTEPKKWDLGSGLAE